MFVPAAKAPPEAGAKELSYKSLNLAYSGHPSGPPCFGPNWFIQFCHIWREYAVPRKALPRKQANVDTGHQILPGLAQGSFQIEKLDRTTKAIAQINEDWKVEKAQYAEFNVPTCGTIAVWQLCKETKPLWKSHDGLNLTCLDQCHRVCSRGKSSSRSWGKRIVIQQSDLAYSGQHPCFGPNRFIQFCHKWRWNTVCLEKLSHGNRRM